MTAYLNRGCVLVLTLVVSQMGYPGPDGDADDFLIVDCLLPGQVRQLGTRMSYVSARRAAKLSAHECETRGGEYVRQDAASRNSGLSAWLPAARDGDTEAQINVAMLYERGLGEAPDYRQAAHWYGLAAEQGAVRAQLKMAELFESGLGVSLDLDKAASWYERATGQTPVILEAQGGSIPDLQPEVKRLGERLVVLASENAALEADLGAARLALTEERRESVSQRAQLQVQVDRLSEALNARREVSEELEARLRRTELALGNAESEVDRMLESANRLAEAQKVSASQADQGEAAIQVLSQQLQNRESALTQSSKETQALHARLAELEARADELAARQALPLQAAGQSMLAAPRITLIDPQPSVTRGLVKVTAVAPDRQRIIARVTAPAGLMSVTINGLAAEPNSHGVISSEIQRTAEAQHVVIVAIDQMGQRAEFGFELLTSGVNQVSASPEPSTNDLDGLEFGRYHALVIGNNDYRYLPPLQTAVTDAAAVGDVLEVRYGFRVTRLANADRYAILSALNVLRETLTDEDNLVIYYAGHGELDEVNMRGHWLPVDAEAKSTANWISNVAITDILNAMQVRHVLLLADSCYSGAITRSVLTDLRAGMTTAEERNWIETMLKRRARLALTSGGLSPVLDSGGGAHSVFAAALLDVLRGNTGILEGRELYERLAARVAYQASNLRFEQVPEFAPISHAGHEAGEFFLKPTRS